MTEKTDVNRLDISQLKESLRKLESSLREERARGLANEMELKAIKGAIVWGFWAFLGYAVISIVF